MKDARYKKNYLPGWKVILLLQLLWLISCGYAYNRDYVEPAKAETVEEMALEVSIKPLWNE